MSICKHKSNDGLCLLHSETLYKDPCHEGPCHDYTAMTNADRIRAMTNEELANYIWQLQNTKERRSTNGWLDWLKKEVDCGD